MAAKKRGRPTRALVRRSIVQAPLAQLPKVGSDENRVALGRTRGGAVILPVPPPVVELPSSYAKALAEPKQRIRKTRLTTIVTANTAMVRLYWHVGNVIHANQGRAGWGAKVIDRLSYDLRKTFPDMAGLSSKSTRLTDHHAR